MRCRTFILFLYAVILLCLTSCSSSLRESVVQIDSFYSECYDPDRSMDSYPSTYFNGSCKDVNTARIAGRYAALEEHSSRRYFIVTMLTFLPTLPAHLFSDKQPGEKYFNRFCDFQDYAAPDSIPSDIPRTDFECYNFGYQEGANYKDYTNYSSGRIASFFFYLGMVIVGNVILN